MENSSVFDIIGPNMIGPSSSHTAGALRIALIARKIVNGTIKKVRFILYGSFAQTYKGHGTDKALLAGILGFDTFDERIRDAFTIAKSQGLEYHFEINKTNTDNHPNTVDIIIEDSNGQVTSLTGVSIGGGKAIINKINGADIMLTNEYNTIFVTQYDKPGVVAFITKCLSDAHVNIAFMRLFRKHKGDVAYTVIEFDEDIKEDVLQQIKSYKHILSALLIKA